MSVISILFILFFYIAIAIFTLGITYKIVQYARTPVPFKIPISPTSLTRFAVIIRIIKEVFLFSSLFKASKWTWLFGWLFHWSLFLIFIRHLPYFWSADTFSFLHQLWFLKYTVIPFTFSILGLLGRRIFIDRLRYISAPSDYLWLFLFLLIAITGLLMTFAHYHPNLAMVYNYAQGLVTFNWSEVPRSIIFLIHISLFYILIALFPISKMLHMVGVFFSPTINQIDNAREKRHISKWGIEKEDKIK